VFDARPPCGGKADASFKGRFETVRDIIVHQNIERQRDLVFDLDLVVESARKQVDGDVNQLRDAVRERDRARVHLQHLMEMAEDEEAA